MSLVAYGYSSGEESESDEDSVAAPAVATVPPKPETKVTTSTTESADVDLPPSSKAHLTLPAPRSVANNGSTIEEEDDEFLRKKAVPEQKPTPKPIPTLKSKNGRVQITVPSLKDFKEDDTKRESKPMIGAQMPKKSVGLLGMLPKPKSGAAFTTTSSAAGTTGQTATANKPIINRLIPDSVANRPRGNNANPKPSQSQRKTTTAAQKKQIEQDLSDDSDGDEQKDFFSLSKDDKLPEISVNEINAMVAKRAARMAQTVKQYDNDLQEEPEPQPGPSGGSEASTSFATETGEEDLANDRALASLIGGNKAKRVRLDEINIIDISSSDIVPTKEDFLRRKLQDETGFVPTGHLTGDWTCTSKRKSHITYLASKAQDNAQELEAMWAANRQSRRQTQSKYGF